MSKRKFVVVQLKTIWRGEDCLYLDRGFSSIRLYRVYGRAGQLTRLEPCYENKSACVG